MPPEPSGSNLTLLSHLSNHPINTKVRFLGCIASYDPGTATLFLTHHLSIAPTTSQASTVRLAKVNISTPLPLLDIGSLRNGEWINVIGYLKKKPSANGNEEGDRKKNAVYIDALHVWNVGPGGIDLGRYEQSLQGRIEV